MMQEARGVIDLHAVQLAEDRPTWLHAFPVGEYRHPLHGKLTFTRERLQRFVKNIRERARGIDLAIDWEHGTDPSKGKRAAGWITDAEVRQDGLYLAATFTDEARREIRAGHWRYLSPEFVDAWEDNQGRKWHDVLLGAALTNRPFLKDLAPVAATETLDREEPVSDTALELDTKRRIAAMALAIALERNRELTEQLRQATAPTAAQFSVLVEAEIAKGLTEVEALHAVASDYPEFYNAYRNEAFIDGSI